MRPFLAALSLAGLGLTSLPAQNLPDGLVAETVATGFTSAITDFCFLPDGRAVVTERSGGLRLVSTDGSFTPTSMGTLPSVRTGSERALLGIAADPNFASNGYIYMWFTRTSPANAALVRGTLTGDRNNPSSNSLSFSSASVRRILNTPDSAFNHNGGSVVFGPDGMLYVSIGDDANNCSAQSLTSQRGCLLRLDVSGLAAGGSTSSPSTSSLDPGNNPLSGSGSFSALVISYGLRNPVRMTCDQQTGDLFIADVGQNAREELNQYVYNTGNLQLRNYGWPWREGISGYSSCGGATPSGLVGPITDTAQSNGGWFSTMGGLRYRNQGGVYDLGASYEGRAFWTDYFSGQIREIQRNANGTWSPAPTRPGAPSTTNFATGFVAVTGLKQGPDGAIYVAQQNGTYSTSGGFLKRIKDAGVQATAVSVQGAGNFNTQLTSTPPRIGQNMSNTILTFNLPYTLCAVYGSAGTASVPFGNYTILIDTSQVIIALPLAAPLNGIIYSAPLPIPNDANLIGFPFRTQGLMLNSTEAALTNAFDVMIGN